MSNNKLNIDNYTRKLVNKIDLENPSSNFSENVMAKILNSPSFSNNLIIKDEGKSNVLLFISLFTLTLGYFLFSLINNQFDVFQSFSFVQYYDYLHNLISFFTGLNINYYLIISLIVVILIAVVDKIIVRKMSST